MKLIYCLMAMLWPGVKGFGQDIKALTVGDRVPNILIQHIYNYPAVQCNLSAFKDKLVILDFMGTACVSCVKVLPHFDTLQQQYGDKMQIILVSYEKGEKVKKFLAGTGEDLRLPIAAEDILLSKYFVHSYIPHEVWIKDGIVKAITNTHYVRQENIDAVLGGKFINWPVKHDVADFDFANAVLQNTTPLCYGVLGQNIKDVPAKFLSITDTVKRRVRNSMYNLSIPELYLHTYGLYSFVPGFTFFEVTDRDKYVYDKERFYRDAWKAANTFCYECLLPAGMEKTARGEKMRSDLDTYFGLHGRIEKKTVLCNVVTKPINSITVESGNMPVAAIVKLLNEKIYGSAFIDETGYKGRLTIDPMLFTLMDVTAIKNYLQQCGLEVNTLPREVTVFVLTETKAN